MSAQSANRIGFNKGTKNQGIMQENSIQNVDSDGGCRKDSTSDFDRDNNKNARGYHAAMLGSISQDVGMIVKSLYGVRCDIDHLDTRLRDLVLLTRDLKTLEKKREGDINNVVLLLAFISTALVAFGLTLYFR